MKCLKSLYVTVAFTAASQVQTLGPSCEIDTNNIVKLCISSEAIVFRMTASLYPNLVPLYVPVSLHSAFKEPFASQNVVYLINCVCVSRLLWPWAMGKRWLYKMLLFWPFQRLYVCIWMVCGRCQHQPWFERWSNHLDEPMVRCWPKWKSSLDLKPDSPRTRWNCSVSLNYLNYCRYLYSMIFHWFHHAAVFKDFITDLPLDFALFDWPVGHFIKYCSAFCNILWNVCQTFDNELSGLVLLNFRWPLWEYCEQVPGNISSWYLISRG